MTIDELKQAIEQRTGVPAALLNGETAEENIALAKTLLAYKKEHEAQRPKSTSELFAEWFTAKQGIETRDAAGEAMADIEEAVRVEAGGYPIVKDATMDYRPLPDSRPAREQFAEWFSKKTAWDPKKDSQGWGKLI